MHPGQYKYRKMEMTKGVGLYHATLVSLEIPGLLLSKALVVRKAKVSDEERQQVDVGRWLIGEW